MPRYRTELGFDFWFDVVETGVSTSDPGIYFRYRVFHGRDIKFSYGELVVDGKMITLTNREGELPDESPKFNWRRTEAGKTVWRIERLFSTLEIVDVDRYPWLGQSAPTKRVTGIYAFEDRAEQDRCLSILVTLLKRHDADVHRAINGVPVETKVEFGDDLMAKIADGRLIEAP